MTLINRRNLLGASFLAPLAGTLLGPAAEARSALPPASSFKPVSLREKYRDLYFPNVTLRTQENKEVRFYDDLIKDKVVTINFMYTSCGAVCPLTTERLVGVQKLLGDRVGRQVFMYSLTIDPQHDTPDVLKKYMEVHGVKPGWTFLTGKPEDLELLRRRLGLIDPDPKIDRDRTNHIGTVLYGNEPLLLWTGCPSLVRPEFMVKSIFWNALLMKFDP